MQAPAGAMGGASRPIGPHAGLRAGHEMRFHPWEPQTLELLRRFEQDAQSLLAQSAALEALDAVPQGVVGRSVDHLRSKYLTSRGLHGRLSIDPDLPDFEAPEGPVRSMLEHLVDGGLRANAASDPYCHVGKAAEDDESVTLFIRDNGVPIPECTPEQIRGFIQEAKVDDVPDRVYRLFLADNLARWVGGSLWVGPTANGAGTTVFLKLPKQQGANTPNHPLLARHVF